MFSSDQVLHWFLTSFNSFFQRAVNFVYPEVNFSMNLHLEESIFLFGPCFVSRRVVGTRLSSWIVSKVLSTPICYLWTGMPFIRHNYNSRFICDETVVIINFFLVIFYWFVSEYRVFTSRLCSALEKIYKLIGLCSKFYFPIDGNPTKLIENY